MFDLAKQTIRARKGGFAATFIALFCGAALVTACGMLFESALRGGVPPERYVAATVVVGAKQSVPVQEDADRYLAERVPLPASLVEKVDEVAGVERAIGDVSIPITMVAGGKLVPAIRPIVAHGQDSLPLGRYGLQAGTKARASNEVVLDLATAKAAGATVGDVVQLAAGSKPKSYEVVGIADQVEQENRQSNVWLTDATARQLTGRPTQVDAIGVVGASGTSPRELAERIERALGEQVVTYTGHRRGDVEFLDAGQSRSELTMLAISFAGSVPMIAMLVVASTLTLAIQQRRREFALLRAIGATPLQVRRMIASELWLVSLLAGVLGSVPGIAVGYLLRNGFAAGGLIPPDFQVAWSPLPMLAAVLMMVVTAQLSGLIAGRRPARLRPVDAFGEAAVEPRTFSRKRLVIGLVLGFVGVAASALPLLIKGEAAAGGVGSTILLLVVAVIVLGPKIASASTSMLGPIVRTFSGASGYLASVQVSTNSRRLGASITPLVLAISFVSVQIFMQTTTAAAAVAQAREGTVADFVVSGAADLSPDVVSSVREVEGVRAVTPMVTTQVIAKYDFADSVEIQPFGAQGVDPRQLSDTLDLSVTSGRLSALGEGTVALSEWAAGTLGASIGDKLDLTLGDGTPFAPRVVAIYQRGLGFGDFTMARDAVLPHVTSGRDSAVLVRVTPGASRTTVGAALGELASTYPGLAVADQEALQANLQQNLKAQSWGNLLGTAVVLGYLAIAIANTLVLATADRAREFALLRLVGASRRQVARMIRTEASVVVLIAVVVGSLITVPPLVGISLATTGSPIPYVPPLGYAAIVLAAVVFGLMSMTIPARLALRTRPVDAVTAEA
ncbi:ABC transporter permease [Tenggerimyces flavus]|uniref:ABC transporter permease n=1 Tax=Tenggerimyces flavus TaxID=1708749 RepID=A0ABV7Y6B7_9ACTN|nr:FtsX-like permease family protein [Tenggerimyces flavus]MBM7785251.1 putative ABC transport system permease protein [Tenggerimyces flavus]